MNTYLKQNIEWFKSFFSETYVSGMAGKASSRRVFEFAIVWVFLVAFLKVALITATLLDMPWGWFAMFMGILGLKTYERMKTPDTSDNGSTNGDKHNDSVK
jgi:hypothetical protein